MTSPLDARLIFMGTYTVVIIFMEAWVDRGYGGSLRLIVEYPGRKKKKCIRPMISLYKVIQFIKVLQVVKYFLVLSDVLAWLNSLCPVGDIGWLQYAMRPSMSFSIVYGCIMLFPTPKHSRYMFIGSEMLYKNCVKNSSRKSHVGHDIRRSLLIFKFKVRVYSVIYCKTNCLNIFLTQKSLKRRGHFLIWTDEKVLFFLSEMLSLDQHHS